MVMIIVVEVVVAFGEVVCGAPSPGTTGDFWLCLCWWCVSLVVSVLLLVVVVIFCGGSCSGFFGAGVDSVTLPAIIFVTYYELLVKTVLH